MTSPTLHITETVDFDHAKEQLAKVKEQVKILCEENNSLRRENGILREQVARFHPSHTVQLEGISHGNGR